MPEISLGETVGNEETTTRQKGAFDKKVLCGLKRKTEKCMEWDKFRLRKQSSSKIKFKLNSEGSKSLNQCLFVESLHKIFRVES